MFEECIDLIIIKYQMNIDKRNESLMFVLNGKAAGFRSFVTA